MSPMKEKLGKDADAGDYIDDFMKSDAPQFKGKSKRKEKGYGNRLLRCKR